MLFDWHGHGSVFQNPSLIFADQQTNIAAGGFAIELRGKGLLSGKIFASSKEMGPTDILHFNDGGGISDLLLVSVEERKSQLETSELKPRILH